MELILAPGDEWTRKISVATEEIERAMDASAFMWMYGIISYQDVFGLHETRFCHRYTVNSMDEVQMVFALSGPPEYNRAT